MNKHSVSIVPLPKTEISLYFVTWVGGVFYAAYHVYLASQMLGEQLGVEELEPGWNILDRRKDVSDYEWRMWLPFLWELSPWILFHHIGAELFRWLHKMELLRAWYVVVTLLFITHYCGVVALAAVMVVPMFLLFAAKTGGTIGCWGASILFLLSLNLLPPSLMSEEQQMALYVCFAWIQLRCISFCVDWVEDKPWSVTPLLENDRSELVLRMFSYIFYLPLMFLGPFVPFHEFEKGMKTHSASWKSLQTRLLKVALNCVRFIGWLTFTEFCLHFIYCNAIQLHHEALVYLDTWTLHGLAYCIGQFFLNKYVVVYGLMGTFAEFDCVKAPPVPRCIAHISTYSDMWRYFDNGFYIFLRSYIYDPLVGRQMKRRRHVFYTTVCFAFVYIWHGLSANILVWSVCNYLGILLESLGHEISNLEKYQQFERYLSPQNIRRWHALVTSPLFVLSAMTMFFFLSGMEVGIIFVQQIFQGSVFRNLVLLVFAYCLCQVSLEIKLMKIEWRNKKAVG